MTTRLADRILATDDTAHGPSLAEAVASPAPRMLSAVETVRAYERSLSELVAQTRSIAEPAHRSLSALAAQTRSIAEALAAEARQETATQYRRALAAAATRSQEAARRRAALTRRAASASGPRLTYLLALSGDADALDVLRDRLDSDEFAAEIVAALDAETAALRVLAWTVAGIRLALTTVAAFALYSARWTAPRPTSSVLRYSCDPSAPPAPVTRPADRPTVGTALAEAHASISTPIQEHDRIET